MAYVSLDFILFLGRLPLASHGRNNGTVLFYSGKRRVYDFAVKTCKLCDLACVQRLADIFILKDTFLSRR